MEVRTISKERCTLPNNMVVLKKINNRLVVLCFPFKQTKVLFFSLVNCLIIKTYDNEFDLKLMFF